MKTHIRRIYRSLAVTVCAVAVLAVACKVEAQNLFAADFVNNRIIEISPNGTQTVFATNGYLVNPNSMAFDKAGNLFVVNENGDSVTKITPNGAQSQFATGFWESPSGLTFDSAGNLYVCTSDGSNIVEFTTGGTRTGFATNLFAPTQMAFNRKGDLFATSWQGGYITEFSHDGVRSTNVTGLNFCVNLAIDKAGNLFVEDLPNIDKITPGGVKSIFTTIVSNNDTAFYTPAMTFDSEGNLYVANVTGGGTITKFARDGTQTTFATGVNARALAFQPIPEMATRDVNGTFQLSVSLPPSCLYPTVVQASSDSVNWTAVYTNTPPYTFTDSVTGDHRFYRAALTP